MKNWIQKQSILYYLNIKSKQKSACFDLDGTIITPKSNRKFPIDENDWKFIDMKMVDIINQLSDYNIIIFTNQSGLDKKLGLEKFKQKIVQIKQFFNQDISVIIAFGNDYYRKPLTGMWDLLQDYSIPLKNTFYVGDAAGRKSDHSDSDLNFAHNIGIKFILPEVLIQKYEKPNLVLSNFPDVKSSYIDIKKYVKIGKLKIKQEQLELIILVGFPGSGKSTFALKYYHNYTYINQDLDKTKEKIHEKIQNAIKNTKSIIIDNTNMDAISRKKYIDMVKKSDYIIKIIIFDIPINVCQHMMYYRTNKYHVFPINIVVYRTLNKKCEYNNDGEILIKEPKDIQIYRINKIYVDNNDEYTKIINFRTSLK